MSLFILFFVFLLFFWVNEVVSFRCLPFRGTLTEILSLRAYAWLLPVMPLGIASEEHFRSNCSSTISLVN